MNKASKVKIEIKDPDINYSSEKSRANFKRLYFDDLRTYYTFKSWIKNNLTMYDDDVGDFDEPTFEHIFIFLNYLKNKFSTVIDRPHWYKKISSILRYAIKLKHLPGDDDE